MEQQRKEALQARADLQARVDQLEQQLREALQARVGELEQQQKDALRARVGELEQRSEALQAQVRGRAGQAGSEGPGGHGIMQSCKGTHARVMFELF